MKSGLPIYLTGFVFFIFALITLFKVTSVNSAEVEHIVISEVKVRGAASANDEFIELYNPSSSDVDLTGWRLTKKPQDGSPQTSLIASLSGTIASHGFFLLTHDESPASSSADLIYSSGVIADNNTLSIYREDGTTLVDKVGFGTALDSEATSAAQPDPGQSIERKANSSSTPESMSTGTDQLMGNGEDTDNNLNDFIIRTSPDPQNSQSALEPEATASASPSAAPTEVPTPTPTASPSAIPTATPSASPTSTPSASPTPHIFHRLKLVCSPRIIVINFGFFTFNFPDFTCRTERI